MSEQLYICKKAKGCISIICNYNIPHRQRPNCNAFCGREMTLVICIVTCIINIEEPIRPTFKRTLRKLSI